MAKGDILATTYSANGGGVPHTRSFAVSPNAGDLIVVAVAVIKNSSKTPAISGFDLVANSLSVMDTYSNTFIFAKVAGEDEPSSFTVTGDSGVWVGAVGYLIEGQFTDVAESVKGYQESVGFSVYDITVPADPVVVDGDTLAIVGVSGHEGASQTVTFSDSFADDIKSDGLFAARRMYVAEDEVQTTASMSGARGGAALALIALGESHPSIHPINDNDTIEQYQKGVEIPLRGFSGTVASVELNGQSTPFAINDKGHPVIDIPGHFYDGQLVTVQVTPSDGAPFSRTVTASQPYPVEAPVPGPENPVHDESALYGVNYPAGTYFAGPTMFFEVGGEERSFQPTFINGHTGWTTENLMLPLDQVIEAPEGMEDGVFEGIISAIRPDGEVMTAVVTVNTGERPIEEEADEIGEAVFIGVTPVAGVGSGPFTTKKPATPLIAEAYELSATALRVIVTPVINAHRYRLYRSASADGERIMALDTDSSTLGIGDLPSNEKLWVSVTAVNALGESDPSAPVEIQLADPPPAEVPAFTTNAISSSMIGISQPSNHAPGQTYTIKRRVQGQSEETVVATDIDVFPYRDTVDGNGETYEYAMLGTNAVGSSVYSEWRAQPTPLAPQGLIYTSDGFESGTLDNRPSSVSNTSVNLCDFKWLDNNKTSLFRANEDGTATVVWNNGVVENHVAGGPDWRPMSGNHALRFRYPAGSEWTEQRFTMGVQIPDFWCRFWLKVPSNFRHNAANHKFFALWMDNYSQYGDGATLLWEFWPADSQGNSEIAIHWNDGLNLSAPEGSSAAAGHMGHTPWINVNTDLDRWMEITIHAKVSTQQMPKGATTNDGQAQLWQRWEDEETPRLIHDYRNANFNVPANGSHIGWETGYLLGWYNGGYAEDTMWVLDDFQLYDQPLIEI